VNNSINATIFKLLLIRLLQSRQSRATPLKAAPFWRQTHGPSLCRGSTDGTFRTYVRFCL